MRRFAGLSLTVIAAELDCSPSKVRDDLARIMTTLSRELGEDHGERDNQGRPVSRLVDGGSGGKRLGPG